MPISISISISIPGWQGFDDRNGSRSLSRPCGSHVTISYRPNTCLLLQLPKSRLLSRSFRKQNELSVIFPQTSKRFHFLFSGLAEMDSTLQASYVMLPKFSSPAIFTRPFPASSRVRIPQQLLRCKHGCITVRHLDSLNCHSELNFSECSIPPP